MNKFEFLGRLTSDIEKVVKGNTTIVNFNLAVDRFVKKENRENKDIITTDFFSITAFNNQANFLFDYVKKGKRILVIGKVQNNNYIKSSGEKIYTNNFIAREIFFADSK